MTARIEKYLRKKADLDTRPLVAGPLDGIDQVVVIPVRAERDYLFETLDSLAANPAAGRARTLVICVVNNAPPSLAPETAADNREALARLDALVRQPGGLRLAYVDASSPGREFGAKEGVGLARKIGLDFGLHVMHRAGATRPLLLSLDADTLVEPGYLAAVRTHFETHDAHAAVVAFAHRLGDPAHHDLAAAIVCYELSLRYYVLGLAYAGSPYAFHSVGSTMVCTGDAYASVSGMNRRQGGEDFYFLQQLAKTGGVGRIHSTTVHPSPRPSARVPFGTGPRVRRFLDGRQDEYLVYHPACFEVIKGLIELIEAGPARDAAPILADADAVHPLLKAFLDANGFGDTWGRLQRNAAGPRALVAQFHCWFDGFRTLKLIHFLRDHAFPQQDMFQAIARMLEIAHHDSAETGRTPLRDDLPAQIALLERLRALERPACEQV
ncbi:MAG: glycosyltransferase family 2 protein [Candidatus Hydrogenedentes bacterium]|nr:glycosyltransferase family 2 protein [Candidatus Hydrogenedentota bacterium]